MVLHAYEHYLAYLLVLVILESMYMSQWGQIVLKAYQPRPCPKKSIFNKDLLHQYRHKINLLTRGHCQCLITLRFFDFWYITYFES